MIAVHPSEIELKAYGHGRLTGEPADRLEAHLAECEECCRALEEAPADSFVGRLREAKPGSRGTTADAGAGTLVEAPTIPAELTDHPRYRIVELIGQGGMGAVYKAEHRRMQRPVALKIINPGLLRNPAAVERFHQEARATARLNHPNIVTAHDADQAGGLHFLVMEYVEGTNLSQLLHERGALPIAEACEFVRQAALGLQHLHEAGLIHRDVKPHNLMVTPGGMVKLLDCGLVRFAQEPVCLAPVADTPGSPCPPCSPSLTAAGTIMGTADYIAPEQVSDPRAADIRSDIYSLGCTLFELLTGRPPFPEGTTTEKFKQHAESPLKLPTEWPETLQAVVARMTAKMPADRFATPNEVAAALEGSRVWERQSAQHRTRRERRIVTAILAVAAFLIVAAIVIRIQTDRGEIVVSTNDKSLEIVTRKNGEIVRIRDPQSGQTLELNTKDLHIRDLDKPDGLALVVPWAGRVVFKSSGGAVVVTAGPQGRSPRLPDTPEEVLPALAGVWKGEYTQKIYGGKPAEKKISAVAVNGWIVGKTWLRQRVQLGDEGFQSVTAYEPGSRTFRDWFFHSRGLIFGPSTGRWDAATRTMTWTNLPEDGVLLLMTFRFVDSETFAGEILIRDKEGKTVFEMSSLMKRTTENIPIDENVAAGPLPKEMAVLDRYVGDWQFTGVIKDSDNPDGRKFSWPSSSRKILGGRFIVGHQTGLPGDRESYSLATYDTFAKAYQFWLFRPDGTVLDHGGGWDEKSQTMKWHWAARDGSQSTSTWQWREADSRDWQVVTKDALGKTTFEVQAAIIRQKEPGWLQLFNGKNFDGWIPQTREKEKDPKAPWSIAADVLIARGGNSGLGWLRSARTYENYTLKLKFRLPRRAPGDQQYFGDTGVVVHRQEAEPVIRPTGFNLMLGRAWEGRALHVDVNKSAKIVVQEPVHYRPAGEWNDLEVTSNNGTIEASINGKLTITLAECQVRKGYIALFAQGVPIDYRDIALAERGQLPQLPQAQEKKLPPEPEEKIVPKKPFPEKLTFKVNFPANLHLVRAKISEVIKGKTFGAADSYRMTVEQVFAGPANLKGKGIPYVPRPFMISGPRLAEWEDRQLFGDFTQGGEMLWWVKQYEPRPMFPAPETPLHFKPGDLLPVLNVQELEHHQIMAFPFLNTPRLSWLEGLAWARQVERVYQAKTPEERGQLLRQIIARERPAVVRWAVAMIGNSATPEFRKELLERAERDVLPVEEALLIDRLLCRWEGVKWFAAETRSSLLREALKSEKDAEFDLACRRLSDAVRDNEMTIELFMKLLDGPLSKSDKLSEEKQWSLGQTLRAMRFEPEPGPFVGLPQKPKPYGLMSREDRTKVIEWLIPLATKSPSAIIKAHAEAAAMNFAPFGEEQLKALGLKANPEFPTQEDENVARRTAHYFATEYATKSKVYATGPFYLGGWLVPREKGWELPIASSSLDATMYLENSLGYIPQQFTRAERIELKPTLTRDPVLRELARTILKEKGFFYVVTLEGYGTRSLLIRVDRGHGTLRGIMPTETFEDDPLEPGVRDTVLAFVRAHNAKNKEKTKEFVGTEWCHGGTLTKIIGDNKIRDGTIILTPYPTMGRYGSNELLLGQPGFGEKFPARLPETIAHVMPFAEHRTALLMKAEGFRKVIALMGENGYVVFLGDVEKPGGVALLVRMEKDATTKKDAPKVVGTLIGLH